MSTTLTNGLKLPDKGSVDWYADMQNNYTILDNAVGAIAGKAAASHTHGNITNAGAIGSTSGLPVITGTDGVLTTGAFGNTAGTFCEGNDSRLSDARTPLVHTHTKSDITDLFNSANEWTGVNTYTTFLRFSAANYSAGTPASDIFYGSLQWGGMVNNSFAQSFGINNAIRSSGVNDLSIRVYSQTGSTLRGVAVETNADASNSSFRPLVNNVTDLGSSSYQWKSIYSQTYYYNGTQWGLDQANSWTNYQTINGTYLGNEYSSNARTNLYLLANRDTEGQSGFYIRTFRQNRAQGAMSSGDVSTYGLDVLENGTRTRGLNYYFTTWAGNVPGKLVVESSTESFEIRPTLINGVNPGALSLPDTSADPLDTTGITWDGTYSYVTINTTGWVFFAFRDTTTLADGELTVFNGSTALWATNFYCGTDGYVRCLIPVVAGLRVRFRINLNGGNYDRASLTLYPCQGNV